MPASASDLMGQRGKSCSVGCGACGPSAPVHLLPTSPPGGLTLKPASGRAGGPRRGSREPTQFSTSSVAVGVYPSDCGECIYLIALYNRTRNKWKY